MLYLNILNCNLASCNLANRNFVDRIDMTSLHPRENFTGVVMFQSRLDEVMTTNTEVAFIRRS